MLIKDALSETSMLGLLGLTVSVATVGLALLYAIKPTESRLALMRPVSLAAIFGGLTSFIVGLTIILIGISNSGPLTTAGWGRVAAGVAEALVALVVTFGCLTIAWLLVAVGLQRADRALPPAVDLEPPAA